MIEVLKDGKEIIGFYRSKKPIGKAHMVSPEQMANEYERLESENTALRQWLARLVQDGFILLCK